MAQCDLYEKGKKEEREGWIRTVAEPYHILPLIIHFLPKNELTKYSYPDRLHLFWKS